MWLMATTSDSTDLEVGVRRVHVEKTAVGSGGVEQLTRWNLKLSSQ